MFAAMRAAMSVNILVPFHRFLVLEPQDAARIVEVEQRPEGAVDAHGAMIACVRRLSPPAPDLACRITHMPKALFA